MIPAAHILNPVSLQSLSSYIVKKKNLFFEKRSRLDIENILSHHRFQRFSSQYMSSVCCCEENEVCDLWVSHDKKELKETDFLGSFGLIFTVKVLNSVMVKAEKLFDTFCVRSFSVLGLFFTIFGLLTSSVVGQDVVGCGGFVRTNKNNIDVTRIQVALFNKKNGNLRFTKLLYLLL